MIPNADSGHGFCVNLRKVNKVTILDKFPMLFIDDIFDKLQGSEWFSEIDLNNLYWSLSIKESDFGKTAFSTPIFGENSIFIQLYLDNFVIHSNHSVTNHFQFFLIKQEKLIEN
jgi:hypothetical protein